MSLRSPCPPVAESDFTATSMRGPGSFPEAMTPVLALGEDLILEGLAEEMLPVADERVRRLDAIHPVHGLRIASKIGASSACSRPPPRPRR